MRPVLALVGSHIHGKRMVETVAADGRFKIGLVVTDDPRSPYSNADKRLWRYWFGTPELDRLARLVPDAAAEIGLTAFTGRVRPEDGNFRRIFEEAAPDAIVTSVFGQRLPGWMLDFVGGRAWNVHNVIPGQPLAFSRGPQPIEKALALGVPSIQMVLHQMSEEYDDGPEVGRSEPFPLPCIDRLDAANMLMIQQGTAPLGAALVQAHLPGLLGLLPPLGAA